MAKREKERINKEHGDRIEGSGLIGGPFTVTPNPPFLEQRAAVFERLFAQQVQYALTITYTQILIPHRCIQLLWLNLSTRGSAHDFV
jgi:hypothetical protein